MALSADRPDLFVVPAAVAPHRTTTDDLYLVPPDSPADAERTLASLVAASRARSRRENTGCLVPLGGGVLLAVVAVIVDAALGLTGGETIAIPLVAAAVGAVATTALTDGRIRSMPVPDTLPAARIHPRVVADAPADLPAADIVLASRLFFDLDLATENLRKARADATLTAQERYVSPGDRSTWYYAPEDLPVVERAYEAAADRARSATVRMGFARESD